MNSHESGDPRHESFRLLKIRTRRVKLKAVILATCQYGIVGI